jgi:hypothetical protein
MVFGLLLASYSWAAVDQITLYVPAFEGPGALGQNVATILNLQIWHTFRQAPWPNPNKLDFGKGLIVWDPVPLATQSHSEAERRAKELEVFAQIVLWGKAYSYGHGVVVQSYVSIPLYEDFRDKKQEIWQVMVKGKTIEVDIPKRRYEMAPIVLTHEVVEKYTLPNALKIYKNPDGNQPIGSVGDVFIGLQFDPNRAKVRSGNITGWVRLPQLAENRTEVVDFVGGLVRILRGDWEGAAKLMKQVVENSLTPTSLRIDAYLYWARALEQSGMSGREVISKAYALNPYSRTTLQYAVMSDLATLARLSAGLSSEKQQIMERIKKTVEEHAYLFPKNDPWMDQLSAVLRTAQ